jgi:hypothetical protein
MMNITFAKAILLMVTITPHVEYWLFRGNLPEIPRLELYLTTLLIHCSSLLWNVVWPALCIALGSTIVKTPSWIIGGPLILLAITILYVGSYIYRKKIFQYQYHKQNWNNLGISWSDCERAIWSSFWQSIVVFWTLLLPLCMLLF